MKDRNKTLVFVDAGYFSILSKHFGKGKYLKVDLIKFTRELASRHTLWMEHWYYYSAPPYQSPKQTPDEVKRKAGYDSFVSCMNKEKNITIREGRLQKIDGEFTQKGVDTLLTMDLTIEPLEKEIKTIILLASDTDFVPILNMLRTKQGIKVILYYYTDKKRDSKFSMSNFLLTACDECIILSEQDFTKNLRKK